MNDVLTKTLSTACKSIVEEKKVTQVRGVVMSKMRVEWFHKFVKIHKIIYNCVCLIKIV
jgi:hypothetical protein